MLRSRPNQMLLALTLLSALVGCGRDLPFSAPDCQTLAADRTVADPAEELDGADELALVEAAMDMQSAGLKRVSHPDGCPSYRGASVDVWANPRALSHYIELDPDDDAAEARFPVGSVIVTNSRDNRGASWHAMVKVRVSEPAQASDWSWWIREGEGGEVVESTTFCMSCHQERSRPESDHVFGLPASSLSEGCQGARP
jgi:predicted small lipoprotein YifL